MGGRSLRYVEEHGPVTPGSTVVEGRFTMTLREGDSERVVEDIHRFGVFPRATWMALMERAGLEVLVLPYIHSEIEDPMEMFVGFAPTT